MGDEDGHPIRFNSKYEAEDYIEKLDIQPYIGDDPESIMVVPEIETM
ncbi:uncharacterized protein METZ01_LOCUS135468 [marine metagenome]|uniref:Uncharacterized protein n=1 Tax=marine metagenome TaxID=408172 RepID=A0A381Z0D1_9ZZZZ